MATITLMETKDGKRFFKIAVSRGYGITPYTKRWYWPDGWSEKSAQRGAKKEAARFELDCKSGKVQNRAEKKKKDEQDAVEAAKIKNARRVLREGFYAIAHYSLFRAYTG